MSLGDRGSCLAESMKVHKDLVSSLSGMEVVDREIEIVGCNRALSTLVH
jgi:hypothetical protein